VINLVLLEANGTVKICDFGFSNLCNDGSFESLVGSPEYVSPEIIAQKPYGPEIDIWSMGVILYVMLSGSLPFYDKVVSKMFVAIMSCRYTLPEHFSSNAKSLLQGIFKRDPRDRSKHEHLFAHPWTNLNKRNVLQMYSKQELNAIPKVSVKTLESLGFRTVDIEDYVNSGKPGPIKAASFLTAKNLDHFIESKELTNKEIESIHNSYLQVKERYYYPYHESMALKSPIGALRGNVSLIERHDYQSNSPVCAIYSLSAPPNRALAKALHAFESHNVQFDQSDSKMHCSWRPILKETELTLDDPDFFLDQLYDQMESSVRTIDFVCQLTADCIRFELVSKHDEWSIDKFQELTQTIIGGFDADS
jgi:serine/threonine protein kinase